MDNTCQCCKAILGCRHLADGHGRFIAEKVITKENLRECPDFEEIGDREKQGVRDRLYELSGLGYLRTLHELPGIMMDGLRQGEKDELMYEEIPDFQDPKLLYEGMPVPEREEVLRYETDGDGNVIVEADAEGNEVKRARPTYHLKQYAIDPDGPIRLNQSVAWFWTTNQLVDHILKAEADAGILFKEKKSRAKPKKDMDEAPQLPPAEKQERETKTMAEGKRVRVTRGGAGKKPVAGKTAAGPRRASPKKAGVAKPATTASSGGGGGGGGRVARPPRGTAQPKTESAPAEAVEMGAGFDLDALRDVIEASVSKIVQSETAELKAEIAELKGQLADARQTIIESITIFHDIMAQTGGTLQWPSEDEEGNDVFDEDGNQVMEKGPDLYPKDSKIFAYIDGTAFEGGDEEEEEDEGEE